MLRKINIWLLVVAVTTLIGCSDEFLTETPTDSISAEDALSTPANMNLILNGLHRQMYAQSPLPGGSNSRAGQQYFIPMFDVLCGDLIHTSPGNGWMTAELNWTSHTSSTSLSPEQLWYQRYAFIASANSIINKIAADGLVLTDELNNILGQSYAYRAWAYHQLVTTYGKGYIIGTPSTDPSVPLLLATEAPYESAPRSTVEAIYVQIEADIKAAIEYFKGASGSADKSNISIYAAYGIQARIALSKGDWATAATAAENARGNGTFPLLDESEWLTGGFNSVDLSEVIWGGTVIDSETTFFRSYFYLISPTFNGSQNRSNPKTVNKIKYELLPSTDYRRKAFLPKAPNTNSAASDGLGGSYLTDPNYDNEADFEAAYEEIIEKYGMTSAHNTAPYMHVKFLNANPGTIDPDDVIYMRSSEMILIEAESKAMLNDITGAQNALAELGEARDSAFDKTKFGNQADLMKEIKLQRYIELYGEGFSWLDHIRWDEGIDLTGSGAAEVLYQNGFMQEKPSTNDAWVWKIPQGEIDANTFISESDQN